ncbi:hypothetical protein GGF32_006773 [Allomyces javanicus]|nr:hypothetical protein GGF32_006773 [Allomyces javanicus]
MKLQALFVLAAAAAFVAADANPFAPDRAASEDAFFDDVSASTVGAPAPINAQHPHLAVAAALKKPTKPGQRRRRTPKKPLTPEQKQRRQAKLRARRARLAKAGKNAAGRVAKTVKTRRAGIKRPRMHGKPGGGTTRRPTRKPKTAGVRTRKVSLATRLQNKINSLPVGSPLRVMYERRLARIEKPKTAALMAMSGPPGAIGASANLRPFVDPPLAYKIRLEPDGSPMLVRGGMAPGRGVVHRYGFQTATPLVVPKDAEDAIIQAQVRLWSPKPNPGMCETGIMSVNFLHGDRSLGGEYFRNSGTNGLQLLKVQVPVSALSPTPAPITVQAAHDHENPGKCLDLASLMVRGLDVKFNRVVKGMRRYSVSEDAFDDDAWDETYDGGDFSVANEAGSTADDDESEDASDGEAYSVSEDALEGDDMWEDMYDSEAYSVEDAYTEDAADDEY